MSAPIGSGDFVEHIGQTGKPKAPISPGYVRGSIYVVSDVGVWGGQGWLNCRGMPTPTECGYPAPGWAVEGFRPIYKPRASFIEGLLQPTPREPATVE